MDLVLREFLEGKGSASRLLPHDGSEIAVEEVHRLPDHPVLRERHLWIPVEHAGEEDAVDLGREGLADRAGTPS